MLFKLCVSLFCIVHATHIWTNSDWPNYWVQAGCPSCCPSNSVKALKACKKLSGGMLSLASVKSRLVLRFWYWLTWVVLDKGPFNGCCCCNNWVQALQGSMHRPIQDPAYISSPASISSLWYSGMAEVPEKNSTDNFRSRERWMLFLLLNKKYQRTQWNSR